MHRIPEAFTRMGLPTLCVNVEIKRMQLSRIGRLLTFLIFYCPTCREVEIEIRQPTTTYDNVPRSVLTIEPSI